MGRPSPRPGGRSATGLADLFANRLPLNRKERFFTGTVLPMIVACDDFAHLGRFLGLCGLPSAAVDADPDRTNVELFTEYGFQESLDDGARERFSPPARDTPDVLVYVEGSPSLLLGVEAKVFHRPSTADLERQLRAQADVLSVMKRGLGCPVETAHVALLPAGLGAPEQIGSVPVLTWERVAEEYRDVAPAYWLGMLDEALRRYDELASKPADGSSYGQNCDDRLTGHEIVARWRSGDRTFTWMGRSAGLRGAKLREDLTAGRWRDQPYEVRRWPLPGNRNWFPIESFVDAIEAAPGGRSREGGVRHGDR